MSDYVTPIEVVMKVRCRICGEMHDAHSGILGAFYLCDCRVICVQEGDNVEYEKVELCG